MAQSHQTGNSIVTTDNSITDLLSAPLDSDWTVDQLAEEVLSAIAARGPEEAQEFVLDAEATSDRQSRRLLRPLLACLATKSAAEAGTPPNLYGGGLAFKRLGHEGPVWILANFENRPGTVRVAFRRTSSPPQNSELTTGQLPVITSASSRVGVPLPTAGASEPDDRFAARMPTDSASLGEGMTDEQCGGKALPTA
jgi:hypothetical protein